MIKCILSSTLLFLGFSFSFGQNIPIETWRTHFSYRSVNEMVSGSNSIICAANNGLFYIDVTNNSHTLMGKNDGLSDARPTAMHYDLASSTLVLGYGSGLVDIVKGGKVFSVRGIEESVLIGDKQINDASVLEDRAYVGNGFGIIVIDLNTFEIIENYRSIGIDGTDVTVFELLMYNNHLVALTDDGVQIGNLNDNLLDYNNWQRIALIDENIESLKSLALAGETLYVIANNQQILKSTGSDFMVHLDSTTHFEALLCKEDGLYGLTKNSVSQITEAGLEPVINFEESASPISFIYRDGFWVGDANKGVLTPDGQWVLPNGPMSDSMTNIRFTNNQLYAFYGPHVDDYFDQTDSLGFDLFDNIMWQSEVIPGVYNLTDAATFSGEVFISSAGFGLYNYSKQAQVQGFVPSYLTDKVVIPELAVSENLYIPCYEHQIPLYVMNEEMQLTEYDTGYTIVKSPISIDVSRGEAIWLTRSSFDNGGGAICLNLDNDDYRILTTADGLPSNMVNDVVIDRSDEAWVATTGGLGIFPDATFIFDEFGATEPIYNSELIYEDQNVTALAVDGGNRIWIGTEDDGLWVFDNSMIDLQYRFQVSNSPLPGNHIKDLAYNPKTGEMFVLTNKGLASFRSNSSSASGFHSNVKIFPNPVRPGYSGNVGIEGLTSNASLKITDVNGKLIRSLQANGGSASWNLLDYNNQRVLSGIYVVFSSSADGEQTYIGKVAVVN